MKKIISIILSSLVLFTACSCGKIKKSEAPAVSGNFNVTVLDSGKSDAIILRSENHTVIIDCGEKSDSDKILDYLDENNITYVDYLFITHFDKDHVGGAAKVIKKTEIGEIITPDYEGSVSEYDKYTDAVAEKGITPTCLTENMTFTLDDVLFEVYPPMKQSYEEGDNDYSLAISVTHGENSFLFAGDAENERLNEFTKQFNLKHDFLKVPHHGRLNESSEKFLNSVNPSYAVITCGKNDMPSDEVLEMLNNIGCEVYLTTDGTVETVSNGESITISQ
jgi:beta-lactamase superfamily II metal-dependent hydrolase